MYRVSVVVAVYNGERFLLEQFNSILNQTRKPDELIVIDDKSQDGSVKILEEICRKHPEIHLFRNEENEGYAATFWKGLTKASNDYIFLADQDDVWELDKIERMVDFMQKHKEALSLVSSYTLINEAGGPIKDRKDVSYKNDGQVKKIDWKAFLVHPGYPGMAMCVRKDLIRLIQKEQYEVNQIYAHDWLLNEVASRHGGMYFWDQMFVKYRIHSNNTVGVVSRRNPQDMLKKRRETMKHLNNSMSYIKTTTKEEARFICKLQRVLHARNTYLGQHAIVRLFVYDMFHLKYVSLRSLIGDIYVSFLTVLKKSED